MRGPNDAGKGLIEKRVKGLAIQIFRRRVLHSHAKALVEALGRGLLRCLMNSKKTNMAGKMQAKERVVQDQIMQGLEGHCKELGPQLMMRYLCKLGSSEVTRSCLHFRSSPLVALLRLECREARIETRELWGATA